MIASNEKTNDAPGNGIKNAAKAKDAIAANNNPMIKRKIKIKNRIITQKVFLK